MLQLQNVTGGYGDLIIFKDISFHAQAGEKICIIGPNGSGKTTLLKAIVGFIPYQGELTLFEKNQRDYTRKELAKRVGFLSQMNQTHFPYTVYETVMLGRYAEGGGGLLQRSTQKDEELVRSSLERVGMLSLSDRPITYLSGGELQRVFLAKVFAQEPELIILDEPTNHLDLKFQIELLDQLDSWVEEGEHTVVAVLHDINLALGFASRFLLMSEGKLVFDGGKKELLSSGILNQVYGLSVREYMQESYNQWRKSE